MLLPALWLPALPLTGDELVRVRQGGAWVYPRLADVVALSLAQFGPALASANAAIVALAQRVAALEGKPDPCVALTGTLPVATIQVGTAIVQVPVAGLLSTDRVAVAPAGDLPAGLSIAWAHPSPTAPGVLVVGVSALVSMSGKPALTLNVTALR